jgi:formate hydrogenlyase subunit 4
MVIYSLAIGTFFLALSGMEIGTAFGGFGASREMTISALAEVGLVFSLLTLAIIGGSTNLLTITNSTLGIQNDMLLSIILAAGSFFIVMMAEASRYPFDNPSTHLELTMIHEAMIIEYSGKRLALMEWASANKLLILATIGANLFFPWGIAQSLDVSSLIIGVVVYLVKILIICVGVAVLESTMAKFRFFRLPDLLAVAFILDVLAIGLIH